MLAAIACVAAALRFTRLDLGWFGVDQARDVAIALDIVTGRSFPTIGPTMRRVTRLGALYHYFWALPYLVWHDPVAGYWFAACLSALALVLTWWVARHAWGADAGVAAAAIAAAHPVWVIDGRICWAPAALPCTAAAITALMLRPPRRGTIVAVGALLGLAVQLHITMAAWVAAIALLLVIDRVPVRALLPGIVAAAVVGAPALWAMAAPTATAESGLAALPTRAPHAPIGPRLLALATLPARVLAGMGGWTEVEPGGWLLGAATLVVAIGVAAGLVRMIVRASRGERAARVVLVPGALTSLLVLWLPGDAWYYYLDAALPLWALAVGALFAGGDAGARAPSRVRGLGIAAVLGAAAGLAICTADWLWRVGDAGYMHVDPSRLTLDGRPGRDAASTGRVTTVAVKRDAARFAAAAGGDVAETWRRLHGPALADATGDNAFWLGWALERTSPRAPTASATSHVAFWYADDPTALALAAATATPNVASTRVGPLLAVRYEPAIDYAACEGDGVRVPVPIRVTPDPRRYGDGTPALPATLPARVMCPMRPAAAAPSGGSRRRVVAALGGAGTVALAVDDRSTPAAAVAVACASSSAAVVRLAIDRPASAPAELDLYDVPLGAGCADDAAPPPGER